MPTHRRSSIRRHHAAAALLLAAASAAPALGVVRTYVGPNGGFWGVDANWTGGSFPLVGDDAILGTANTYGSADLNVTFNVFYGGSLGTVTIDSTALTGTAVLNQTFLGGTALSSTTEYVGKTVSLNVHNQSTGSNTVDQLYIGYGGSATGTYNLSAAGLLNDTDCNIGYAGSGTFVQTGGTHQTYTFLNIGNLSASS